MTLHSDAIVIDGTCPALWWREQYPSWIAGGATACVVSVAAWESCRDTVGLLGDTYRFLRERDDLVLATTADDIRAAKRDGKLAVVLHFQGTQPVEYDAGLVEVYWRLGVRVVQLTYNVRSPVGDGCEEPNDAGLSRFGRQVVGELNRLGMIVDVSHTGLRTSLDAVEASTAPVIASHSNCAAVHHSRRNLTDDLIRALAAGGGVIGANGYGAFVVSSAKPTLDDYIDHIAYLADLVGTEHVGIGLDYTTPNPPLDVYEQLIRDGVWSRESYPPPPWHYPAELEDASGLPRLTERLFERGFGADDVRGILGENWLRVFGQVWR
ncbi:membrane dipeptidase [Jiangella ureilytica]|uniref:Membrane dipeptidase n=1 Tax=Jiangella ureilytica TaxID=2530374 RepID=A0A4R4RT93_9ACTN|nr:dipeptidase [Jiangella ureilytica]TDC53271.1 membrane dipeptidase [Jiangella ureilytica]